MNVYKLDKYVSDVEVVTKLNDKNDNDDETIFVLDENENLFQFIQKLDVDGINLNNLKIVNEITFNFEASIKNKKTNEIMSSVKCLSEVLEYIDKSKIEEYKLILSISENNRNFISEIIQQFIYLELNLDVMIAKEESERDSAHQFKRNFIEIQSSVKKAIEGINKIEALGTASEDKEKVLQLLNEIIDDLSEAEKRDLSLAVMATKKSGKSVIVNSILGNEYAPTSTEVATPNSVIYKKSKHDKILLDYNNETKEYKDADDIRNQIEDAYKEAEINTDLGYSIDDMFIKYKSEEGGLSDFTIIDTPGPNLAGSKHEEIAYKWIEMADVIIFVVDYSKYLTTDEERFLRNIKTTFEKYDKFYSLIVVANKIDLMYTNGEKTSAIRFMDFLRFKLKELGYNGVVVFATSAMQYFSAVRVPKLEGCDDTSYFENGEYHTYFRKCKKLYSGKREMATIRFLENTFNDLEDYFGITEPNLEDVKDKSGVPRLIEYTKYIMTQKANIELISSILRKIDDKYTNLKNKFLSFEIGQLSEMKHIKQQERNELLDKIKDIFSIIDSSSSEVSEELDFTELKKTFADELNGSKYELYNIIYDEVKTKIEDVKNSVKSKDSDELRQIAEDGLDIVTPELQTNFDTILYEMYNKKLGNYQTMINSFLNERQNKLIEIDKEIQYNIDLFNEYLNLHLKDNDIKITLPKLELAFSRKYFDFKKIDVTAFNEIQTIVKNSMHKNHGLRGKLIQMVTFNKVDKRFGKYSVDFESIDNMMNMLLDEISNQVQTVVKEHNEKMIKYVNSYLDDELLPKITKDVRGMIENYKSLFCQIEESVNYSQLDVDKDLENIQEKINTLKLIKDELKDFFECWDNVRKQSKSSDHKSNRFLKLVKK